MLFMHNYKMKMDPFNQTIADFHKADINVDNKIWYFSEKVILPKISINCIV